MRIWVMAARPRTLPAAIAPVLVGTAAAVYWAGKLPRPAAFAAALVGSIFIQIGTNLANDYSDAKRGADTADRLGPVRVTSAGLVTPQRVLNATWIAFGVAVACGIYLTTVAGVVILVIGALSIAAGVLYTGGPRPYGYEGLGEVFVFLFFGLVAVNGSYYVQVEALDALPLGLSIAVGFLATAILVVNNVRDIETDRRAGKMTLAVRMGRHNAVVLYRCLVLGAFVVLPIALVAGEASALPMIGWLALPLAIAPDEGDDQPHRRARAQRRPRRHRRPARRLQPARLRRPAARQLSEGARLSGMRIASLEVIPYALPFREPYVTARGRLERREMVLLRLRDEQGLVGLGEAVPLSLRGGAALAEVVAELEALEQLDTLDEEGIAARRALGTGTLRGADRAARPARAAGGGRSTGSRPPRRPSPNRSAATRRWSPASPPRWRRTRSAGRRRASRPSS